MTNGGARRLLELSEEIAAIAAASARAESDGPDVAPPTATRVRRMIRARRVRDESFEPGLFADPAWDMMLDLLATRLEGRRAQVSSVCAAAAVPTSTALRWIGVLEEKRLLVRTSDPADKRRVFIDLSELGYRTLLNCLSNARSASEPLM